jgi:PAS domain S-box-containing protein
MPIVKSELALLRHPRVAALATSAWPAWLWTADGSRLLWANAVGAAIFGAANTSAAAQRRFDTKGASAALIVRLATTLPAAAQERLERLRGFGADFGRALTCACSRIVVDGKAAVLIAAAEPAGPALTLAERVRRLFPEGDGAFAAFAAEGKLIYANPAAQTLIAGATTLSALGIEAPADTVLDAGTAIATGTAQATHALFDVDVVRIGKEAERVVVLTLARRPAETPAPSLLQLVPPSVTEAAPQPDAEIQPEIPQCVVKAQPAAPPSTPAVTPPPAPPALAVEEAITERRHPLRFVWQMDADGRFGLGSDEFLELVGSHTMAAFGRPWSEIAAELKLDADNLVARALATRETWSGIVISWPVDDSGERLPVELSGLPVFDRDRNFRGYRGFGVCRDIARINQLARARRERPLEPAPEAPPQRLEAAGIVPPPAAPATTEPAMSDPKIEAKTEAKAEANTEPKKTETRTETKIEPAPAGSPAPAANVVPFRPAPSPEPKAPPVLSPVERRAFRELAQELTARLRGPQQAATAAEGDAETLPTEPAAVDAESTPAPAMEPVADLLLLDRIPIGILIYRHDALLYANRYFLEWSGYDNLGAIEAAGGIDTLFAETGVEALTAAGSAHTMSILTRRGDRLPVDGRMFTVPWNGASALALVLNGHSEGDTARHAAERAREAITDENRELKSILGVATDGVITLDAEGRILGADARAIALFGAGAGDLAGQEFGELFAPGVERAARDYFDRVRRGNNVLDNVLEVEARAGGDRRPPLAMTLSRIGTNRFCAVFRDATARKQTEDALREAKRETQRAAAAKAEFLAKVSHEIRTPLNAMTGFAEVIMAERFGPIGNERYREYVRDIHAAGTHIVALLNDLLDLSKAETGQIDLNFANVNLNELTQQCVAIMQGQANRARIIIRTSLTPNLPRVLADERSLRQIVLNLLSNSIRFTGPGGQVIVSTVFSDAREGILRVRDTGAGMSEKDIQAALEPFNETATSGSFGSGGTGFGLSLTKALAEANRAHFNLKSAPNAGTLVEVAFPPSRVVAD